MSHLMMRVSLTMNPLDVSFRAVSFTSRRFPQLLFPALKVRSDRPVPSTLQFSSVWLTSVRENSACWFHPEGSDAASSAGTSRYTDRNPSPFFPLVSTSSPVG